MGYIMLRGDWLWNESSLFLVLELDMEGTITPDEDLSQEMGDLAVEVTEEMRDQANEERTQGSIALSEGGYVLVLF